MNIHNVLGSLKNFFLLLNNYRMSLSELRELVMDSEAWRAIIHGDFLMMAILTSVVISHCGFDLHFSNNERCRASFHVFASHLYVFFGEMSV